MSFLENKSSWAICFGNDKEKRRAHWAEAVGGGKLRNWENSGDVV